MSVCRSCASRGWSWQAPMHGWQAPTTLAGAPLTDTNSRVCSNSAFCSSGSEKLAACRAGRASGVPVRFSSSGQSRSWFVGVALEACGA